VRLKILLESVATPFDEDGPIWLAVERLSRLEPPAVDMELRIWIDIPDDPAKPPSVRQSAVISVDGAEKDRLIAACETREEVAEAVNVDGTAGIWSVRVWLEDRPHLAARLDAYVSGPWASWSETEGKRRTTIAIYERLLEMAEVARAANVEQPLEFVWGVGVARRSG
jgi:hypothetical protein